MPYQPRPPVSAKIRTLVVLGSLSLFALGIGTAYLLGGRGSPYGEWERVIPDGESESGVRARYLTADRWEVRRNDTIVLTASGVTTELPCSVRYSENRGSLSIRYDSRGISYHAGPHGTPVSETRVDGFTFERDGDMLVVVYGDVPPERPLKGPGAVYFRRVGPGRWYKLW